MIPTKWLTTLEWLTKITVPLAIAGYLISRARYHYLGISWRQVASLNPENYFEAVWNFCLYIFQSIIFLPLFIFLVSYLVVLTLNNARDFSLSKGKKNKFWDRFKESQQKFIVPGLGLFGGFFCIFAIFRLIKEVAGNQSVVLGDLTRRDIGGLSLDTFQLGLSVLFICLFLIRRSTLQNRIHLFLIGCTGILILMLLISYGYTKHKANYPSAIMETTGKLGSFSGVLMNETDSSLVVWRVNQDYEGYYEIVEKARLKRFRLGPLVNIVTVASKCAISSPKQSNDTNSKREKNSCQLFLDPVPPKFFSRLQWSLHSAM